MTRAAGLVRLLAAAAVLTACTAPSPSAPPSPDHAITVAGFDFPESSVLAEIYAQALERAGMPVRRELSLGPREIVLPALQRGLVDLVPEYEGSATAFLGGTPSRDPAATHTALEGLLAPRGLRLGTAAPAQDRNAFVVPAALAQRHDLHRLSDLGAVDGMLRLGGPPECPVRPYCLLGLEERYGLTFDAFVPLDAGGPLTLQGLRDGFVDVGLVFTTDPVLDTLEFVALADDRGLQPTERIVPIVRDEILDRYGLEVLQVLDEATADLTTPALRAMNATVADGEAVEDVARDYLDGRYRPAAT